MAFAEKMLFISKKTVGSNYCKPWPWPWLYICKFFYSRL